MTVKEELLLKNNQAWAQLVMVALVLSAIIDLCSIFIFFSLYSLLDNQPIGFGYDNFITALESLLIQVEPFLVVFTILLFFIWFYRVYANLHVLRPASISFAKKWAVGCWLIPIIHFHRPYEIIREIWMKNQPLSNNFKTVEFPIWINCWWFFFILMWILTISIEMIKPAVINIEGFKKVYILSICTYFISIIAAFLAIAVVFTINQQEKKMLLNEVERDIYDHLVEN